MHISNGTETEEDGRGHSKAIHNSTPFIGTKNTATWDSFLELETPGSTSEH
jgi:hypothetical protein